MGTQDQIAQNKVNLETAEKLGEISSDIKSVLRSQQRLFDIYSEHEERIKAMEGGLAGIKVKIGVASAFVGALAAALIDWMWKKLTKEI